MARTTDTITNCLERNWDMIETALAGMDDEVLARAPAAECNSAAWILWHLTRIMDMFVHVRLQDAEQLWTRDGWAEKFSVQPGIEDRGVGWTAEQVAADSAVPRGTGGLLPRGEGDHPGIPGGGERGGIEP